MKENNKTPYTPCPIDVSDIKLSPELLALTEIIAENAHDSWAKTRIDQGWVYGAERNDNLKTHPNLVPYSELKEFEKDFDRIVAMDTLRLIEKLGFEIIKK